MRKHATLHASARSEVGRYLDCSTPAEASHGGHEAWRANFTQRFVGSSSMQQHPNACGTFCHAHGDLYLEDRCWNTRALCAVALSEGSATLVVGQRESEPRNLPLQAGRYLTVLGPAAALGVGARSGFADRLREAMGIPVINLGRGAAGPSDYIRAMPTLSPLLAQAHANIVVLMAGRSSANSAFPAGRGASGAVSMARDAGVKRLHAANDASWSRLVNESLASALAEYSSLAASIRRKAETLGRAAPPFMLLWFSACEMSQGCHDIVTFPQYYTDPTIAPVIASRIGALLVDASFAGVKPAVPLALDQCRACGSLLGRAPHTSACWMDDARRQTNLVGFAPQDWTEGRAKKTGDGSGGRHGKMLATLGCTQACSAVVPTYYPHDAAHEVAAARLIRSFQDLSARVAVGDAPLSASSPPPARLLPSMRHHLPRIDPRRKMFFNHVHKSAGSSFTRFLRHFQSNEAWCDHVMQPNWVAPRSYAALRQWWIAENFSCRVVSLEEPWMGELFTSAARWAHAAASPSQSITAPRTGNPNLGIVKAHAMRHTPQLLSFLRHPVDRCLSSWRYEFALCHGSHASDDMHKSYCDHFVGRYGNGTDLASQRAFVDAQCSNFHMNDLDRSGIDVAGSVAILGLAFEDRDKSSSGALVDGRAASATSPGRDDMRELTNAGENCWMPCSFKPGGCPDFCGRGGACCKSGDAQGGAQCAQGRLGCESMHCCVLGQRLPAASIIPLHFYGLTEAYDASVCLFWYQTGTFTPVTWKESLCSCNDRAALRQRLKQYDSPWTRSREKHAGTSGAGALGASSAPTIAGTAHVVTPELKIGREELAALNQRDMNFYLAAKSEFERRVAIVEERVGHNFLRCDAER